MNDEDLAHRLADIEAKLEQQQRVAESLVHKQGAVATATSKVLEIYQQNISLLTEHVQGLRALQLTLLKLMFDESFDRDTFCQILRGLLARTDTEKQPHYAGHLQYCLDMCEGKIQPADLQKTIERTRPNLRVVDENYSPNEDN